MRLREGTDNILPGEISHPDDPSSHASATEHLPVTGLTERDLPGRSDDPLQLVLDTALDAVVVMRADGSVCEWNRVAEETFGWRREEAAGRQLADLIIPERFRDRHYQGLGRYRSTGEGALLGKRVEVSALRRDGSEFPVELSISPLRRGDSEVFVGFLRDISDRQRTQHLLESEVRRATLLHELTSFAAQSESVAEALAKCLSAVCELIGWPVGHAYLPSEHMPVALVSSIWHCPAGDYTALRDVTDATRFTSGRGLPGRVWKTKAPVWVADVRSDPDFARSKAACEIGVGAAFAIPIKSGERIIAILEFFREGVWPRDDGILLTARALGDQVGRVLERKEDAERQRSLFAELNHRVKNMLAVVVGMATQTARTTPSLAEFQESFTGRVMSLSRTYSLLTSGQWQKTGLKDLITEVLAPRADESHGNVRVRGPHVTLTPKNALTLSVILHELMSNALKHGALRHGEGQIEIVWDVVRQDGVTSLELVWEEQGGEPVATPERNGFGLRLVETSVRHELRGTLESQFEAARVRHRIVAPWQAP